MKKFFAIIGSQRSATTYLYRLLESHPDICMAEPLRPEPKFFLDSNCLGTGREQYEKKYFKNHQKKIFIEKSTTYIEFPEVIPRIRSFYPEAGFIVLLRDPVERAISNYFFTVENGLEQRSLTEVFIEKKSPPALTVKLSTSPFSYLERGLYYDLLKPWVDTVGKERIKILLSENLVLYDNSRRDLFAFLGIQNPEDATVPNEKINFSKIKTEIPDEVLSVLSDYYRRPNEKLSNTLELDLTLWK